MAQESTLTAPVEQKAETPPLRHRICACQVTLPAPRISRCGQRVGKPSGPLPVALFKPIEICVICTDILLADTVCPICGVRPSHYQNA